eukprot:3993476-Prymnesium_polylepis.1
MTGAHLRDEERAQHRDDVAGAPPPSLIWHPPLRCGTLPKMAPVTMMSQLSLEKDELAHDVAALKATIAAQRRR